LLDRHDVVVARLQRLVETELVLHVIVVVPSTLLTIVDAAAPRVLEVET